MAMQADPLAAVCSIDDSTQRLLLTDSASKPASVSDMFHRNSESVVAQSALGGLGPMPAKPGDPDSDGVRIFIGDLSIQTTEASLTSYFSQFGTVVRALVKHPEESPSQRMRSFGFITVIGQEAAQQILTTSHKIDGTHVGFPELAKEQRRVTTSRVAAAMADGMNNQIYVNGSAATRKIFVGGLSHSTKEGTLFTYFSQFGTLSDVVVMTEGAQRRPRGFGFVTFENAASVDLVIRSRFHPIGGRHVEVKPAVPREQMQSLEESVAHGRQVEAGQMTTCAAQSYSTSVGLKYGNRVPSYAMMMPAGLPLTHNYPQMGAGMASEMETGMGIGMGLGIGPGIGGGLMMGSAPTALQTHSQSGPVPSLAPTLPINPGMLPGMGGLCESTSVTGPPSMGPLMSGMAGTMGMGPSPVQGSSAMWFNPVNNMPEVPSIVNPYSSHNAGGRPNVKMPHQPPVSSSGSDRTVCKTMRAPNAEPNANAPARESSCKGTDMSLPMGQEEATGADQAVVAAT